MNAAETDSRAQRNKAHGLLWVVVVLLAVLVGLEVFKLYRLYRHPAPVNEAETTLQSPVPPVAAPSAGNHPALDPRQVWSRPPTIEDMQSRINRMFSQAMAEMNRGVQGASTERTNNPAASAASPVDPFAQMRRMQQQIDNLFQRSMDDLDHFAPPQAFDEAWEGVSVLPALNTHEEADAFIITAAIPGVSAGDIRVSINGRLLTIAVQERVRSARVDRETGARQQSTRTGYFERRVRLPFQPASAHEVVAEFKDGVLTIRIPRSGAVQPPEGDVPVTT